VDAIISGENICQLQGAMQKEITPKPPRSLSYSIFGIGVDRRLDAKWIFAQQKATLQTPQKVYVYSENALVATVLAAKAARNKTT
jgi:hypothetical protein